MPKNKKYKAPKSTWEKIPQKTGKQTITRESRIIRIRRLMRLGAISFGTGSLVLGLSLLGYYIVNTPKALALDDVASSFVELDIETDGVLPPSWIEYRMALEENLGLLQIDMTTVKSALESYPQIKEASIEREFPSKLHVRVRERMPFFRIKVKDEIGESQIYMVDEDGFVFKNIRFPDQTIDHLPFIAGVDLHRKDSGYHQIDSVPCLAELYKVACSEYPELAREWSILFADRLIMAKNFTEGYIRVHSRSVPEILFSPKDFAQQLEKLDYILDSRGGASVSFVSRVNLSVLDQPTVEFANHSYPNNSY